MDEKGDITYAQCVNRALYEALNEYPNVIVYGEDVGSPGGVFGVTKGLQKHFGDRVFDTPISESAILGSAVGASIFGMRPIVEIMWSDFSLVALDQIINQAANVRYISRGQLEAPLTIRMQQGKSPGSCAQHSQSLEAIFAHVPGLRVCIPGTPQDAYGLLRYSIQTDDPAIVIENRNLYHSMSANVNTLNERSTGLGAAIRYSGDAATVVTWGDMQHRVIKAADRLSEEGVHVDVIDIRWLRPLDIDSISESVRRTGRLAVVHEAHTFGGFGAEVVSQIASSGVKLISRPIRIGAADARIPAASTLSDAVIPTTSDIVRALGELCNVP